MPHLALRLFSHPATVSIVGADLRQRRRPLPPACRVRPRLAFPRAGRATRTRVFARRLFHSIIRRRQQGRFHVRPPVHAWPTGRAIAARSSQRIFRARSKPVARPVISLPLAAVLLCPQSPRLPWRRPWLAGCCWRAGSNTLRFDPLALAAWVQGLRESAKTNWLGTG